MRPWLRARYGVEEVQSLTLSRREWVGLAADEADAPMLGRIRDRLALAQLCKPELIAVLSHPAPMDSRAERLRSRREVERMVRRLQAWGVPAEVVGVWVGEQWDVEGCVVESEELHLEHRDEDATADPVGMPCIAVFSGDYTHWLAERTWEDDGGLVAPPPPRPPATVSAAHGRQSHVVPDDGAVNAHGGERKRPVPRRANRGIPRLRPDLAGVAGH